MLTNSRRLKQEKAYVICKTLSPFLFGTVDEAMGAFFLMAMELGFIRGFEVARGSHPLLTVCTSETI